MRLDGSQDNCWPITYLAAKFPTQRLLSISQDDNLTLKSSTLETIDLNLFVESLVQEMMHLGVRIGQNGLEQKEWKQACRNIM